MRILFFGSSSFSVPPLESIYPLVSPRCDEESKAKRARLPSGGGDVARLARRLKLPLSEIDSFKDPEVQDLAGLKPDLLVVVSFGLLIPKWFLDVPIVGAINVHPSLLPKYRGPAPIQWAVRNGESETGITIIKMSERMDAGDIFYQERFSIRAGEDAKGLSQKLSERTGQILPEFLKGIEKEGLAGRDGSTGGRCYLYTHDHERNGVDFLGYRRGRDCQTGKGVGGLANGVHVSRW